MSEIASKLHNYSTAIQIQLLLPGLSAMTFFITPIIQHRGVSKSSFQALTFIRATYSHGDWLSSVHNKGQNHTEDVFYYRKKSVNLAKHGKGALSLHTSISRGKQDQRMFSEPRPADLIIGCFPVCFPKPRRYV